MLDVQDKTERVTVLDDGRWCIEAPAKLNLGLRVLPRRADGFHDIESWMAPLSWHDTVRLRLGGPLEIVVTGRTEGIPTGLEENLVGRAALRLARAGGMEAHGRIELHKVVPPGGGLGGGSSDAGNVLVLLNRAWDLRFDGARLAALAGELGSDVPFFVQGRPALCRGRGERMTVLRPCEPLVATLLIPEAGLATQAVYQAFDAGHRRAEPAEIPWREWAGLEAEPLNEVLVNDLEPAAFALEPWLAELRDEAAAVAGQKVHLTGSGLTLYTLSTSVPRAAEIAERWGHDLRTGLASMAARVVR